MDPYEEVAQQGKAPPLSSAYVPGPMELDEHVPPYVEDASPTAKSPRYIADSDLIEDDTDADSIDYLDELGDGDEDLEGKEHEPEDENTREEEPYEGSDETKPFKEDETAATPPPPGCRGVRISALLGHRATMICMRDDIPEEDIPPRRRFVLTAPPPRCDVAESSASAAARAPRAADRVEDVGYVRALPTFEHRMSRLPFKEAHLGTSTQAHVAASMQSQKGGGNPRDCLQTELRNVHQAYLSSEAWNRALLAQVETLETHMSRMEWQRQSADDHAVRHMMLTHVLEARAQILIMPVTRQGTNDTMTPESIQAMIDRAIQRNSTHTQDDGSHEAAMAYGMGPFQEAYTVDPGEKKVYTRDLPLYTKCNYHHTKQCAPKCGKCKRYGHTTTDCRVNTTTTNNNNNQKAGACYECGNTGHMKRNFLKLKNRGNGNGNGVAQGRAYALGGRDASPDSNVIMGTFFLNNRYATILFDTGVDRSFVSTTFSTLINITPTTLENHYDVELADRKIIGVNTIIRGCTLNFMNHSFNIDLMPVPFGSFDVIIGMD
ncbi:putative reverse transcriptase domain-containing protein [Tanacetum coccineum]